MEFFGDEALIFTKLFQGESHILRKSSGGECFIQSSGSRRKKKEVLDRKGGVGGGGGTDNIC